MTASEWSPAKLDELGYVGRGRSRHRPRNAAFLYGGRYPFFQTGDIKAANFYLAEYSQTYSKAGLAQSKLWQPGTLCITIAANIAESAILAVEGCFPDSVVGFVADPSKADVRFVKYYLEILKLRMQGISHGATQDNLSLNKLLTFDFLVPALSIQRRIAGILSAYDDLIENSQRRIKILEEIARRLYREWFVHFRFPGHEGCTFVESPLGEIPEGWEVKKLGNLADLSWGDTSTTKASYVAEGYAAYSASGLDGKLDHFDFERIGIVLSAIGAQCGRTWLARGKWSCIKNTIRFWSKHESATTEFLFIATEGQSFWPRRGAAQPFISQGDAERIELVIPDRATMQRFTIFANDSLEQIAMLEHQIQNLRRTRDLLLPRLLSGQIDVEALPESALQEGS
jgi:type I restriction enzyme S subunit